ncbi:hypothetical protein GCM10009753_72490 [Streptantibioticus ferralitis]
MTEFFSKRDQRHGGMDGRTAPYAEHPRRRREVRRWRLHQRRDVQPSVCRRLRSRPYGKSDELRRLGTRRVPRYFTLGLKHAAEPARIAATRCTKEDIESPEDEVNATLG